MFITFEGLDFCGKSTQAALLAQRLREAVGSPPGGGGVLSLRDPGGTEISERLRALLLDRERMEMGDLTELMLFSASRAQLVAEVIRPALARGDVVICDRFYDSTTAYQGFGRGLNQETIRRLNAIAADGTDPDVTILIDVSVEEIERRKAEAGVRSDRMESAGRLFYERVREGYRELSRREAERIILINGMAPVERVQADVWRVVHNAREFHKHPA